MIKFNNTFKALICICSIGLIFASCSKKEDTTNPKQEEVNIVTEKTYAYSEKITVYDESGQNSVDLTIQSDNPQLITEYLERNKLEVMPIYQSNALSGDVLQKDTTISVVNDEGDISIVTDSVKLDNNAIGYSLLKTKIFSSKLKTAFASISMTETGPTWYHGGAISFWGVNGGYHYDVQWYSAYRWYSSWNKKDHDRGFGIGTITSWFCYSEYRIKVSYTYVDANSSQAVWYKSCPF